MREFPCCSSSCNILNCPIYAERPESEAPVFWSDNPELVLKRLRQITGRREWWR